MPTRSKNKIYIAIWCRQPQEKAAGETRASQAEASAISLSTRLQRLITEEKGSDVRETVWEMSRVTNKILILGIILFLGIQAVLMQSAILFQGGK